MPEFEVLEDVPIAEKPMSEKKPKRKLDSAQEKAEIFEDTPVVEEPPLKVTEAKEPQANEKKEEKETPADPEDVKVKDKDTEEESGGDATQEGKRKKARVVKAKKEKKEPESDEETDDEDDPEGKFVDLGNLLREINFPLKQCGRNLDALSRWLKNNNALPKGEYVHDGKNKNHALIMPEWTPKIMETILKTYKKKWITLKTFNAELVEEKTEEYSP